MIFSYCVGPPLSVTLPLLQTVPLLCTLNIASHARSCLLEHIRELRSCMLSSSSICFSSYSNEEDMWLAHRLFCGPSAAAKEENNTLAVLSAYPLFIWMSSFIIIFICSSTVSDNVLCASVHVLECVILDYACVILRGVLEVFYFDFILTNKDESVVFVALCLQGCSLPCLNNPHAGCTLDREPWGISTNVSVAPCP